MSFDVDFDLLAHLHTI